MSLRIVPENHGPLPEKQIVFRQPKEGTGFAVLPESLNSKTIGEIRVAMSVRAHEEFVFLDSVADWKAKGRVNVQVAIDTAHRMMDVFHAFKAAAMAINGQRQLWEGVSFSYPVKKGDTIEVKRMDVITVPDPERGGRPMFMMLLAEEIDPNVIVPSVEEVEKAKAGAAILQAMDTDEGPRVVH